MVHRFRRALIAIQQQRRYHHRYISSVCSTLTRSLSHTVFDRSATNSLSTASATTSQCRLIGHPSIYQLISLHSQSILSTMWTRSVLLVYLGAFRLSIPVDAFTPFKSPFCSTVVSRTRCWYEPSENDFAGDRDNESYSNNPQKDQSKPPDFTVLNENGNTDNRFSSVTNEEATDYGYSEDSSTRRNLVRRGGGSAAEGGSWMDRNSMFAKAAPEDGGSDRRSQSRSEGDRPSRGRFSGDRPDRSNRDRPGRGDRSSRDRPESRDRSSRDRPSFDRSNNRDRPPRERLSSESERPPNRTFRQNFRGTRVFVQGLPPDVSWQDLKDHFRVAGEVVFASVSTDSETGKSKGHGIVQYETTEMAANAIAIMRNHPLNDAQLFVREDVQESNDPSAQFRNPMPRGPSTPSSRSSIGNNGAWQCANEENADYMSDDVRSTITSLIRARNDARRKQDYTVADDLREQLKTEFGVHLDDRLKMWWTGSEEQKVPTRVQEQKGTGSWDAPRPWRQIPTTQENDACVNPKLVNALLTQRDIARREKDFSTADALLLEARESPDGDLYLRIHDESRTWRVWTDEPPPRTVERAAPKDPILQCIELTQEYAPEKVDEIRELLEKSPGRGYQILKKLKQRYLQ
jgi:hypothetical protein